MGVDEGELVGKFRLQASNSKQIPNFQAPKEEMFCALHKTDDRSLNLLDLFLNQDRAAVEEVRGQADRGDWVCRQCRQEVTVRAGDERRWYFAHKNLADCPLTNESALLLDLRATLFAWLRGKFGARVSIEHNPENSELPHPIDCWIDAENGGEPVAFWIQPTQVRSETERIRLQEALRAVTAKPRVLLAHRLLRPSDEEPDCSRFLLSTTERDLVQPARYDAPHAVRSRGSLHYLDAADGGRITTLRATFLVHSPQIFCATRFESNFADLLITASGEIVHPGEHDAWLDWRRQQNETRKITSTADPEVGWGDEEFFAAEEEEEPDEPKGGSGILAMHFRCTQCGSEVGFGQAQEMDCSAKTCVCDDCFQAHAPVQATV